MNELLHNRKALIIGGVVLCVLVVVLGIISTGLPQSTQQTPTTQPEVTVPVEEDPALQITPTPFFEVIDPNKPLFQVEDPRQSIRVTN